MHIQIRFVFVIVQFISPMIDINIIHFVIDSDV
jgi:hypothetical protein